MLKAEKKPQKTPPFLPLHISYLQVSFHSEITFLFVYSFLRKEIKFGLFLLHFIYIARSPPMQCSTMQHTAIHFRLKEGSLIAKTIFLHAIEDISALLSGKQQTNRVIIQCLQNYLPFCSNL